MIRSNICHYSNAYILVKGTITFLNTATQSVAVNETNNEVMLKSCALFINCIIEINNGQVDDAKYIDIRLPIYNLMEYGDTYQNTHCCNIIEMNQL